MPARSSLLVLAALLAAPSGTGCSGGSSTPSSAEVPDDSGTKPEADAGPAADSGTTTPPRDSGSAGADTGAGMGPPDGGGSPPEAGPPAATIDYAPYFPTWVWGASGYAFTSLVDLQQKSGLHEATIAFVLADNGCKADQGIEQNLADVKAFIAAGGHVKASFGGADGTYVESQCSTAAELATALGDFVDATGITDLDFDIEQDPVLTDTVNAMRGQALKTVQASKNIQVAFTLAANPHTSGASGGLTSQGLSVVSHAVSAGVKVSHVNLMTMDYGDSYGGQALAPVAIGSLTDANTQLVGIVPGLTKSAAWQMLGVIPMIGKNDDSEVFSVADAKTLAAFAVQNQLGLVSFWSIDRDQVCPKGADYNSCSTVDTTNFQFASIFETVTAP
ncbi:MAG TPA: hypothetical protein VHS09_13530 [Polyangiaceae bacterium]|jgi:chitinase|nr:hypothetical protein [Polyangiaceae bacterium]